MAERGITLSPNARSAPSGPDLDRGAHVCVAGQKSSLEQRLRVEGPNVGSLHRPDGHPPHVQTACPEVKLLNIALNAHPLGIVGIFAFERYIGLHDGEFDLDVVTSRPGVWTDLMCLFDEFFCL
jgi:hypothetical protein